MCAYICVWFQFVLIPGQQQSIAEETTAGGWRSKGFLSHRNTFSTKINPCIVHFIKKICRIVGYANCQHFHGTIPSESASVSLLRSLCLPFSSTKNFTVCDRWLPCGLLLTFYWLIILVILVPLVFHWCFICIRPSKVTRTVCNESAGCKAAPFCSSVAWQLLKP